MNVNEILGRVVSLSHNEDGPDTGLREKALGWVNSAYGEVMDELLPHIMDELLVAADVTIDAAGVGVLPTDCRRVVAILDGGKASIKRLSLVEVERGLSGYFAAGGQVEVLPRGAQTVRVIYLPRAAELVADGEVLGLDARHHDALIWGALVWGSAYERAFSASTDLRLFQAKWEQAKQQMKLFYAAQNPRGYTVKTYGDM